MLISDTQLVEVPDKWESVNIGLLSLRLYNVSKILTVWILRRLPHIYTLASHGTQLVIEREQSQQTWRWLPATGLLHVTSYTTGTAVLVTRGTELRMIYADITNTDCQHYKHTASPKRYLFFSKHLSQFLRRRRSLWRKLLCPRPGLESLSTSWYLSILRCAGAMKFITFQYFACPLSCIIGCNMLNLLSLNIRPR